MLEPVNDGMCADVTLVSPAFIAKHNEYKIGKKITMSKTGARHGLKHSSSVDIRLCHGTSHGVWL